MAPTNDMERIELAVQDGFVQLLLPEGEGTTTRRVPQDVVLKSTILRQAIETVDGDDVVPILLPKGLLMTWLLCIDALDESAARSRDSLATEPRILEFVRAADFLDDQDSLNRLCEHASNWVFEAPENIAERTVKRRKQSFADTYKSRALAASESRFQALSELPENLVSSILSAADVTLVQQISALPQAFHRIAVHAEYPSVATHRCIELEYEGITLDAAEAVWPELMQLTRLKILGLDARGGVDGFEWQRMTTITTLQHLDLNGSKLGDCGLRDLAHGLPNLTSLVKLDLTGTNFSDVSAHCLGAPLESLTQLMVLHLDDNKLGDKGIKALAPHIGRVASLMMLSFDSTGLTADGLHVLGPNIAKLTQMLHLRLGHNQFGGEGAIALAPHIAHLPLHGIELHDNEINDVDSLAILGASLGQIVSLQQMTLDENSLAHDGSEVMGPHLAKLTRMERLSLGVSDMSNQGALVLGPHLARMVALQELEFCFNQLGSQGVVTLAKHVCHLPALTQFRVMQCFVGDEGAKGMGPYIAQMVALEKLDLNRNEITDKGAASLGVHLERVSTLRKLLIDRNYVTNAAADQLRKRLPGAHIAHKAGDVQFLNRDMFFGGDVDDSDYE